MCRLFPCIPIFRGFLLKSVNLYKYLCKYCIYHHSILMLGPNKQLFSNYILLLFARLSPLKVFWTNFLCFSASFPLMFLKTHNASSRYKAIFFRLYFLLNNDSMNIPLIQKFQHLHRPPLFHQKCHYLF